MSKKPHQEGDRLGCIIMAVIGIIFVVSVIALVVVANRQITAPWR